jgi:glycosyltransferase involved in cell wall biosynthesis
MAAAGKVRSPSISIITAVRNGGELFRDTVESVATQNYEQIEYIVIDGQSSDGTVDVIRAYASKISHWSSEPDRGIADAFNKGIAIAKGEYLLFLNSDDRLSAPDAVARMANAIMANGWPVLIYGDCRVVSRATREQRYVARIVFEPEAFRRGATLPHPGLFMHRSYFERFGVYDVSFRIAMDYEILLRGALEVRVVHVPEIVTEVSDGGVSTRNGALVISEIVRAMRMHGVIESRLGEWRTKAYFHGRRLTRRLLENCGLYGLFARCRDALSRRA